MTDDVEIAKLVEDLQRLDKRRAGLRKEHNNIMKKIIDRKERLESLVPSAIEADKYYPFYIEQPILGVSGIEYWEIVYRGVQENQTVDDIKREISLIKTKLTKRRQEIYDLLRQRIIVKAVLHSKKGQHDGSV